MDAEEDNTQETASTIDDGTAGGMDDAGDSSTEGNGLTSFVSRLTQPIPSARKRGRPPKPNSGQSRGGLTTFRKRRKTATDGWKAVKIPEWELVSEADFTEVIIGHRYRVFFQSLVRRMESALQSRRLNGSRADFVILLLEPALDKLVRLCNSAIVKIEGDDSLNYLTTADEMIR